MFVGKGSGERNQDAGEQPGDVSPQYAGEQAAFHAEVRRPVVRHQDPRGHADGENDGQPQRQRQPLM